MAFDPDRLLTALPRRTICQPALGTVTPKQKPVGNLNDYNGFSGKERLRTFEIAKWLTAIGAMPYFGRCDLCGSNCDQQHAEDYYDLTTWIDICRGCHSSLHQRFRGDGWRRRLDGFSLDDDHWARLISDEPFDLAGLLRARGYREPVFTDFLAKAGGA